MGVNVNGLPFSNQTITDLTWTGTWSLSGDGRLDLSDATTKATNTDGGVIKAGTSAAPVTEDTADMKFVSLYWDNGATSGDARGIYNRLAITGAGGGGESLRSFTSVADVAGATAHGAHLSLSFGTSGSVTGQGIATRSTLHMPSTALGASNVTYAALQAEIYSDAATSDPAGNLLSALRILNDGNATGAADVDDDCAALEFTGWTDGAGNMVYDPTVRVRVAGNNRYLILSQVEGTLTLGVNDAGHDVKFFGATAGKYLMWDESEDDLLVVGNLKVTGPTTLTGALTVGVSDTGHDVILHGATASANVTWDESDDNLEINGDARLDLSGATVKAGNTDGGVIKAGTSIAPITEDTASMKFISLYWDDGATSGDARGIYNRLAITGAGGGGESLRSLTSVTDVAGATAHGAHLSLAFGASGSVTGQGVATRSTIHMPTTALPASNVTYAALQAEVYSDGAASDPAGNKLSLLRLVNDGDATGMADVDDDAAALEFTGFTVADGNMIAVKAAAAAPNVTHSIRIRLPDGSAAYLYAGATALTA